MSTKETSVELEGGLKLNMLCHELRNALNPIALRAALAVDPRISEEKRIAQCRTIEYHVRQMRSLIGNYTDLVALQSGRFPLSPVVCEIGPVIAEAVEFQTRLATDSAVLIETVLPADLPALRADRARLVQVFSNLIGRAVRLMPGGGAIRISAEPGDGVIRFSITDGAAGGDGNVRPNFAVAKGIVEAHGGALEVDNAAGEGSAVLFTMPVDPSI